ncbi:MAG: exodeoxyribonuclease VII small subunit [Bacilli bacterium]|jgi:exodeoxyribonuclease VII small subunit|nr:exodeoxyribonuclease VII small subunit [Bacilli bacterium]
MVEKKERTFEEKLSRLQEIVEKVEGETLPLDESMKLFQEGKTLVADLDKTLDEAEEKIGKFEVVDKISK